jgi:8-oxo-dGTP diphosphatase
MQVDDINWETTTYDERAALCFIIDNERILVIRKKKGLGAGKIDAPGGRIKQGETEVEAAARETEEEIGLIPGGLRKMAELHFYFLNGYTLFCTVFFADRYVGTMKETDEAAPFWVSKDCIPYKEMWEDDLYWLPMLLEGKMVKGYFIYNDAEVMVDYKVEMVASI